MNFIYILIYYILLIWYSSFKTEMCCNRQQVHCTHRLNMNVNLNNHRCFVRVCFDFIHPTMHYRARIINSFTATGWRECEFVSMKWHVFLEQKLSFQYTLLVALNCRNSMKRQDYMRHLSIAGGTLTHPQFYFPNRFAIMQTSVKINPQRIENSRNRDQRRIPTSFKTQVFI